MPPLPAEVWMQIVDYLDHYHKIDVSEVSLFLRDIAEPSIYATTSVQHHAQVVSLARKIQVRPNLGTLIRQFKHFPHFLNEHDGIYTFSTHPLFVQSSALLSNLRTLELAYFCIDAAFCAAVVTNWPMLHTLRLYRCSLANDVLTGALSSSGLTTLLIANSEPVYRHANHSHRWNILIPSQQLHTLTFQDTDGFYMDHVLKTVFPRHPTHLPALTTLTIGRTFFTLPIKQLLVNTPNLRHISIRRLSPTDDQLILHPHLIPHLEFFEGPARCMSVFVRGRPVHTVKIHTYDHWGMTPAQDFLSALEESTCPVTQLVLNDRPNTRVDPTVMMSHAPQSLETLGIDGMTGVEAVKWLSALPRLRALRSVAIDLWFRGVLDETLLATLSHEFFPKLQEVVLERKTWLLGDDDVWRERDARVWGFH